MRRRNRGDGHGSVIARPFVSLHSAPMESSLASRTKKKAETMNKKERMRMLEQIRRSPDGVRRIIYIYVQSLLRLRRSDQVNALVDGMVTEILDWEFPESRAPQSRKIA